MNAREKQRESVESEQYRIWYERKMIERWVAEWTGFGFAENPNEVSSNESN